MDKTSYDFLDVLRGTIEDKVSTLDQTIYCKIVGINEDYTLDVTIVPDEVTRIRSVVNASKYEFKVGDYGILYKIGNNLANAFIIAKLGPSDEDNRPLSKQVSGGGDEDGSGETVINNYYQTINSVVAGDGLTSSGTDTVTVSLGTPSASGSGSNTYGSNNVTADSHTHQINLPDASTTAKGVVQLAADNDTTSTDKAVTPKQLETARKKAEVSITAGNGLTGGGTGNSLSVVMGTPSTVNQTTTNSTTATSHTHELKFNVVNSPAVNGNEISFIDTVSQGANGGISATKKTVRSASATQTGVVQLATQDEVNAGTNTTTVITPATLGKGKASGVASLDANSKIIASQLPDYLLGQVMYGGNASTVATTTVVSPSDSLKTKKNITTTSISIVNSATSTTASTYGYKDMEGVYFICQANGAFAGNSFETGDWIISTGAKWEKIDNTDAVKSVNGQIGDVNITKVDSATNADTAATANKVTKKLTFLGNGDGGTSENPTGAVVERGYDGSEGITIMFPENHFSFSRWASDTAASLSLKPTGVTEGTYNSVTVDGFGRVTAGSNVVYSQKQVHTFSGNGNKTSFEIAHTLGSDVVVQVYLTGQTVGSRTVDELVMVDTYTANNIVTLVFATAPTSSQTFKVIITG